MSEITVEQNGSTVDIIGSTGSTVDISETNTISDGNDSIEIVSTGQASTVEIQSTSTVLVREPGTASYIAGGEVGPQGDPGIDGADGIDGQDGEAATITVGTTTTGNPGTQANVTNSGDTTDAIFNFTIPRGATGANGENPLTVSATAPPDPSIGDLWYQP
jgi:hypothetical protein